MSVTTPGQPQTWLTSFRFIPAVGRLRETPIGVRISQNPEQIAVVGVSWHRDLLARLYAGGFLLTHEHLSPGPKSSSAVRVGGLHGAGLLPVGALSKLSFLWGEGQTGGTVSFFGQLAGVCQQHGSLHTTELNVGRFTDDSTFTSLLCR